jgi:hypothetical protein
MILVDVELIMPTCYTNGPAYFGNTVFCFGVVHNSDQVYYLRVCRFLMYRRW